MGGDGSAALGSPEVAGVLVNPRGLAKTMSAGAIGGVVGAAAATAVAGRSAKASDLPAFGRVGYVAASDTEVALIKTKSGALKMKITDETLARVDRGELAAIELTDGKLVSQLRLQFNNGVVWAFDVPRVGKKDARHLVAVLGSTASPSP
jgi:hypothetical protein